MQKSHLIPEFNGRLSGERLQTYGVSRTDAVCTRMAISGVLAAGDVQGGDGEREKRD